MASTGTASDFALIYARNIASWTELKEDLLNAFLGIQAPGSFAQCWKLQDPPPAGLFVTGVGDITLPLQEPKARQLIERARQAPYGKGTETIVDTSVRNTWELDATQFEFRHPGWPGFLKHICSVAAKGLGINTDIHAEIYKMLIYEKGAMFKAHTDTEKIPGMFGTLAICLPSAHEGGELIVKHCGQKKIFKSSKHEQSFSAWYSDVSHEVLPVTSGYRWVLTYNLARSPEKPGPTADLPQADIGAMRRPLERWLSESVETRRKALFHELDHDYTEANISLEALKAQDLARIKVLKEACQGLPLEIFFALLEKNEVGGVENAHLYRGRSRYDHYEDDENDYVVGEILQEEEKIKSLVDLDGRVVTEDLPFDENDMLERDCFDFDGEEKYEGYMGNWGPTVTYWYRLTAVAIVPHDSMAQFFQSNRSFGSRAEQTQIAYLVRRCMEPGAKPSLIDILIKCCKDIEILRPHPGQDDWADPECRIERETMSNLLKVFLEHKRYAEFEYECANHMGYLPTGFFLWAKTWLEDTDGDATERFNIIRKSLDSAIASYRFFSDQYDAVANLISVSKDNPAPDTTRSSSCVLEWSRQTICNCLKNVKTAKLGYGDGRAMVDMAFMLENPFGFISESVIPIVNQNLSNYSFSLGFLFSLQLRGVEEKLLPLEESLKLYQTIARSLISSTDFAKVQSHTSLREELYKRRHTFSSIKPARSELRMTLEGPELLCFFVAVMRNSTETEDLLSLLISKILSDEPKFSGTELKVLWFPLLRKFLPEMRADNVPLDTPQYQQLYCAIFKAFLNRFVGREPINDGNLVRPQVSCRCEDCGLLNEFLTSPTRHEGRFPMAERRRKHLQRKLDSAQIDCTQRTEHTRSPYTLVVTKAFNSVPLRHEEWTKRCGYAVNMFAKFNQEHLSLLLGEEYSRIINAKQFVAAPLQPPTAALASIPTFSETHSPRTYSGLTIQPVAGVKRRLSPDLSDFTDPSDY